jgi:uncharacterized protein YbaR (Trm112 family)
MRPLALAYLACPDHGESLALEPGSPAPEADGHIMSGTLLCAAQGCHYEIRRGVPALSPSRRPSGRATALAAHGRDAVRGRLEAVLATVLSPASA